MPELISTNPVSGEVVWKGPVAGAAEVAQAVGRAEHAFAPWRRRRHAERRVILEAFRDHLAAHAHELATLIARETGKPRWEAVTEVTAMQGKIPLTLAAHEERCRIHQSGPAETQFRPHGVLGVLGPFNFPGHLPNGHIAPALLAGNTVVFKPSEETPGVGAWMGEAWRAAGLPPGVLEVVAGGRETGEALADDPRLAGLLFTGSARVGEALQRRFADRPGKILALEMGGNNPLVIGAVEDLHAAAVLVAQSAWITAGQRCTCARRLIVPTGERGDVLVEAVAARGRRLRAGAWDDEPPPFYGSVISSAAAQAVLAAQAALRDAGGRALLEARLQVPGTGLLTPGLMEVTAVVDRPDEEIFGPLLQIVRVADFDHALSEANATRFGLAAGLLSDDPREWERFQDTVRAGILNWNQPLPGASSAAPFGGLGRSGNFRPSGFLAADYCVYPVASLRAPSVQLPASPPPGLLP